MLIIRAYLFTVAATMVSEMIVVARSQWVGLPMKKHQLLCTLMSSFLPLANLIVLTANARLTFMNRTDFIINFIFAKDMEEEFDIRYEEKGDDEEC
ncbi:MAG: hypothetical protein ACI3T9_05695 [Romboutsia timonensis]